TTPPQLVTADHTIAARDVAGIACTAAQVALAASVIVPVSLAWRSNPPVYQAIGSAAPQLSIVAPSSTLVPACSCANESSVTWRAAVGASAFGRASIVAVTGGPSLCELTLDDAQAASTPAAAVMALIDCRCNAAPVAPDSKQ